MRDGLRASLATARLDFQQFNRSRVVVVLAILEALTFLVLVSLFGLTGSRAPTAIVNLDRGPLGRSFVAQLEAAHHSFDLRPMTSTEAEQQIRDGDLVAVITIPKNFSVEVRHGETALLSVAVDNIDTDLTSDIQEAVPSAITAFGRVHRFDGVRLVANERDLISHDTGYVPYLVVSALALDSLVVAGILGAISITREFEGRTLVQWQLAPVSPGYLLAGKVLAAATVSAIGVSAAALVVIFGYGVTPQDAIGLIGGLALCVTIFTALGACVGALLRRTLPVAALFFGLALPFYIDSGAVEPERFDGAWLWRLGHASPVYSAVAVLEHSFHDLRVTPESIGQNVAVLVLWTVASVLVAAALLTRTVARR